MIFRLSGFSPDSLNIKLLTAARAVCFYAQENPELEEQPERAPDGILFFKG